MGPNSVFCCSSAPLIAGVTDRQTDRHTHTQTDRHTDIQTYRQTDRQTDRQADRQTYKHTVIKVFWAL